VTDFFGNVQNVELTKSRYPLVQQEEAANDTVVADTLPTDQYTSNTTITTSRHLHHSFLVEKKTNTHYWIQSGLGVLSALGIGYVIATTIMS